MKRNSSVSIKKLMNHMNVDMFTRQTLVSLFRCFLETVIESRQNTIILVKLKDTKDFFGLLNRLKYVEASVYAYSDIQIDNFKKVDLNGSLEDDEFLVIVSDRFAVALFWNESTEAVFGLAEGFCTLNPHDAQQIIDHVQSVVFSKELEDDLSKIRQDRRHNERFTSILRKLTSSLESKQRDLICVNTELENLQEKSVETERLASIGQLCSIIAHEIRNPLGMIDMYAKIIEKKVEKLDLRGDTESLFNATGIIRKASSSLASLLNEMLDYSKPLTLNKVEESLLGIVNESIQLIKPAYAEKNVEIKLLSTEDYKLSCDRIKLGQVILNIFKNALEVSKSGDTVEVFHNFDSGLNRVTLKISDMGSGIKTEDMSKIFTPFFTTKTDGTGLGLAQSKRIIEAHGGNISIPATGDTGTTFQITLPVM